MSVFKFPWKKQKEASEERYILSIDGGGIRGIVPAVLLSAMNDYLRSKGDMRPLYSHFDLIAGTSTGALLALGLAMKEVNVRKEEGGECAVTRHVRTGLFSHADVTDGYIERTADPACFKTLYTENARKIFSSRNRLFGSVFTDKYDSSSLEKFLIGTFGEVKLSDAMIPVMVVSYDSIGGKGEILSSYNSWKDTGAATAARASAAAPLYFPPLYTVTPQGKEAALLDGGVMANNPALLAYEEARKLYPSCTVFHILSLSTARGIYRFNPKEAFNGVAGWAEPVMKIYPNAQMDLVDQVLSSLSDVRYTRISGIVTKEKIKLDDTREESMKILAEGGKKMYEDNREAIEAYLDRLALRSDFSQVKLKPFAAYLEKK